MSSLLPLFPLDLVLLPGAPLPLHIFEPRYKEMIGELLASKERFGVVRAAGEGIAGIGCAAEIVALTKEYEDGRMDIVTEGRERFEVMQLDNTRSFLRAEVLYFVDDAERPPMEEVQRLLEMHAEALALMGASAETPPADEKELSFLIAGAMPFDLDFKQTLLVMRSEAKRVAALVAYYGKLMPSLRRAMKARKKAGGNGHV